MRDELKEVVRDLPAGLKQDDFKTMWGAYKKARSRIIVGPSGKPIRERPPSTRPKAIGLWKAAADVLKADLTPGALLGYLYELHLKGCGSNYNDGDSVKINYESMKTAVLREGPKRIHQAITALYQGTHLSWIDGNQISFLRDVEKWERYVATALRERKSKGGRVDSKYENSETFSTRRLK